MKVIATLAVVAIAAGIRAESPRPLQQSVFRASTDVVLVNVSVREGSSAVSGLVPGDFEVLDNGAAQRVEAADLASGPVDLTAVVDLGFLAHFSDAAYFRDDIEKISRVLSSTDRLRILTATTDVEEVRAMLPPAAIDVTSPMEGQRASIDDALLDALMWPAAEGRRPMVVLFTRGDDTGSALRWDVLPDIAERSDAMLELVLSPLVLSTGHAIPDYPRPTAIRQALVEPAARTGGDVIYLADAVGGVKHALEDARASYTLRYTLQATARPGWHDVTVRVTRLGASGYKIRTRKGYFVAGQGSTKND